VRVGDDHRAFQVFSCGDGHLLGRLPTKESAKRQRVVWVEHPRPGGAGLSEEGGEQEQSPGKGTTGQALAEQRLHLQVLGCH
uniref:Uncharacterized protein n=1 Tax=Capra hircus TaxID=9925 RepID=A0A8C2RYX7_CAPHI